MLHVQKNTPLAPYTTFKIGGPADLFCTARDAGEVGEAVLLAREHGLPMFVLGGGSNVLVADAGYRGLVLRPELRGVAVSEPHDGTVLLKLAAGEPWDAAAAMAVDRGWWGIENLSHIPGSSGALAVQNVGAYGQEASQVVDSVEVFDTASLTVTVLANTDCAFSYRKSIFNSGAKGRYIILSVTLRLALHGEPNLSYGDVARYFRDRPAERPNLAGLRAAVTEIRDAKFPYPTGAVNGNAGSFFRRPVALLGELASLAERVRERYGEGALQKLRSMEDRLKVPQGYKTPVAFLLELQGLKGYQVGGAKINVANPAIVLNATGSATAADVLELARQVLEKTKETFGIDLEIEPEFLGIAPRAGT